MGPFWAPVQRTGCTPCRWSWLRIHLYDSIHR